MKKAGKQAGTILAVLFLLSFGQIVRAYAADDSGSSTVSVKLRPMISVAVSSSSKSKPASSQTHSAIQDCQVVVRSNCSWIMEVRTSSATLGLSNSTAAGMLLGSIFMPGVEENVIVRTGNMGITRMTIPLSSNENEVCVYSVLTL